MFLISSLFLALLLSTVLFFFHKQRKQPNLPPSPFKLPIVGNLHQLGSSPHRSLHALSQKHGPLMLLHMGLSPTLIVSSRGAAEEIMKTHDLIFSSRPSSFMAEKLLYGKDVAFAPYDEYWRQARKICIVELLSSKRVEAYRTVREDVIMNMMKKISSPSSSDQLGLVNLSELLVSLTNDIVCRVAFGKKYSQIEGEDCDSGNGSRFKRLLGEFTELLGSFYVGDFIPSLAWIGRLSGLVERAEKNSREWDDLLEGIIKDHEDGKRENVKDFVDVLLRVQKDPSFGLPLTKDHIKALILVELRASVFEAIEEEDQATENEDGVPPALLGSCNDRAKQLHASPSGRLLTALICEYLDWAQLGHTMKVYLPECNLQNDFWKAELRDFSSKNGYDLNRNGESGPLLLDVLEGYLKFESLSQARGTGRRMVTPETESLSSVDPRNIRRPSPSSSAVAGGLPPLGRPVPVSQASDRRTGSSLSGYRKDDYGWRYDDDELSEDVIRASNALENIHLDRKARNLTSSWRHPSDGIMEDESKPDLR